MRSVLKRELLLNLKNLLIWSLSVGALGLVCILLYKSMEGEMKDMADAFSNMGAFSEAFGMSTLSIATLKGYFATEIGAVHGLGSCMFAAIIAINIISKEEDAHTGEFLFSLPLSRNRILTAKSLCVAIMLVLFTTVCTLFYLLGFKLLGEEMPLDLFFTFMVRQFLMNLEVAGICLALSSLTGKNRMGLGLGMALLFYAYDVMGRVIPDLKKYLFIGPFSYANASEIFTEAELPVTGIVVACGVLICGVLFAFWYYNKRDLAS
ncbi:ABC-2 type transport system permease protein [Butyrivibrio proteoclasticus]|uniref:ABC-2 type transport system permease protein n=1 Tax=Butyrivibrio proteoclasticus TaxID=43305 RepID=A0A1I5X806_9FIRM|nr:ABC transporter permease subunit [Butyrivibrio proteoclasticus]SFQ28112.1 ABC-2 type transport system permease protein [Butyrivibrio proteoclasticus]